jgi:hypothetical protein
MIRRETLAVSLEVEAAPADAAAAHVQKA